MQEAALKSKRVVHANVRQATPAWTNTNRVNKANQFTPRPVQLSAMLIKALKLSQTQSYEGLGPKEKLSSFDCADLLLKNME
ncbi:hypothetical protein Tco_0624428 [Tanacetum coccineum]|uniref:Uncharacterized protein n=1 Tax=Tanacetum coccineum TaxID=301880 RepID=A0ABQ4WDX2_9ASTR